MFTKSEKTLIVFILLGWIATGFFTPHHLHAIIMGTQMGIQPKLVSSSFLPVGSGARAMGVGGAFLAIADDATAASWNPAGLIQLKRPQVSIVGNYFYRRDHSTFDTYPEVSGSDQVHSTHLNYFSFAYPRLWHKWNIIFSLNYQHLYDMNLHYRRTWRYLGMEDSGDVDADSLTIMWEFKKQGALSALSPALAIQVTKGLALGMTINFWPRTMCSWDNGWTEDFYIVFQEPGEYGLIEDSLQVKDRYTFSGTNYHFGFQWKINSLITLGGVIKTPFSAELEHESLTYIRQWNGIYTYESKKEKETLDMPVSYGLGTAFRFSDSLTIAFDVYHTEWDKHKLHKSTGTVSPVTGEPFDSSDAVTKPTTHARLGAEYLFIKRNAIVATRFGLFYDPDPSKNHPDDFYGASLGLGFSLKQTDIDLAYQFRFANDVATVSFQGETDRNDISQHLLYLSFIFRL